MGVSFLTYTFLSQTAMILMFMVNYHTLSGRFDYEKNGYHGREEYDPSRNTAREIRDHEQNPEETNDENAQNPQVQHQPEVLVNLLI